MLTGGAGADVFVFTANNGVDEITDFEDGVDMIDLQALTLPGFAALSLWQVGADVQISHDGTFANTITLSGTSLLDLDASDFLF